MNFTIKSDEILDGFIIDFAESNLSKFELQAFSELKEVNPEIKKMAHTGLRVHTLLKRSRKVKANEDFDKRMAAKFAMELQKEEIQLNKERIEKQKKFTVVD